MIKAVIIDDEMHCRKTLAILLKEYCPEVQLMDQCGDAENGIEAIEKLKPDVIFTTGYDQYAIKAFRFYAIDYLLKPIEPRELINAVHKVQVQKQVTPTD